MSIFVLNINIDIMNTKFVEQFVKGNKKVKEVNNSSELQAKLIQATNFLYDGKHLITFDTSNEVKPICMIIKDAPRSRCGYKVMSNYYYRSYDSMVKAAVMYIDNIESHKRYKIERKKKAQESKKKAQESIKVGDLMYNSWGYDQTNIDFYQVVRLTGSSAWIKPIRGEQVRGSEGNMSANVKPIKDSFCGDEVRKLIQGMGDSVYLSSSYGCISMYTSGDDGVYSSWYA